MNIENILKEAGLSGTEIKVYLALIKLGSVTGGEITKLCGVNRTNVYDAIEKLTEKGLVSFVLQSQRKYFQTTDPNTLLLYLKDKESEIKEKRKLVESAIPYLNEQRTLQKESQEATIYKGRKGLRSVAEDILIQQSELLVFGAEGKFGEYFTHYFEQWHMKRFEANIPVRIIYSEKVRAQKEKTKHKLFSARFNKQVYDTPATTWIYGDKVAIVVWAEQPIVTVIRSLDVVNSYRQFFEVMWEHSN